MSPSNVSHACRLNTPCHTLSYYANSTALQLTDSVFYFMPGTHLLQETWTISNPRNLTLSGPWPSKGEAVIQCANLETERGIQVTNGTNIVLLHLKIICRQKGLNTRSALVYERTSNVELTGVTIGYGNCLVTMSSQTLPLRTALMELMSRAFLPEG